MKRIIFLKADGTITVRTPCPQAMRPNETEDEFLDRVANEHPIRTGIPMRHVKMDYEPNPAHKDYRTARTLTIDNKIEHDMSKARELHREKIRERRVDLFKPLDTELLIALGKPNNASQMARIENDKQKLRDAPADPRIDAATTLDELLSVDPLS